MENISTKDKGQRGEAEVIRQLKEQGFQIKKTNWRTPYGEVDIVAEKGEILLFCEVKCRLTLRGQSQGFSVLSRGQAERLRRAAQWIWQKRKNKKIKIRTQLWVVTQCETRVCNLPLLYDNS